MRRQAESPSSRTTLPRVLDAGWFNKLVIVACALSWGSSFVVMKDVTAQFSTFWLLFIRFGLSSLVMLAVFRRQVLANVRPDVVRVGVVLGVLYGLAYVFQTYGIVFTTPGKNAFLTGVYCVLVPFCAWALGHGKPTRVSVIAAFVSLVGMGFVVLDNGLPLNVGDLLTLVAAVFFALEMVVVAHEGRDKDVWALTFWQFLTIAGMTLVGALLFERPPAVSLFTPDTTMRLAFLILVCSFGCLAGLNYALTRVDPAAGSLLSSLESPSGVAVSVMLGYEALTPKLVLGFVLIFAGITFSELGERIVLALPRCRRS